MDLGLVVVLLLIIVLVLVFTLSNINMVSLVNGKKLSNSVLALVKFICYMFVSLYLVLITLQWGSVIKLDSSVDDSSAVR